MPKEKISSLFEGPSQNNHNLSNHPIFQRFLFNKSRVSRVIRNTISYLNIKQRLATIRKLWLTASLPAFLLISLLVALIPYKVYQVHSAKYSVFSSRPLVLGSSDYRIYTKDARAIKINSVFRDYNCPLEGLGEVFVAEADKHNIPWWIVAAISFQESSCGKLTPKRSGIESYNAWGWAVYGDNVQMFKSWARGVETVSEYLYNRFYSKGITDTCEIMKTYTPPSKGSWCRGVNYFGELIQNYNSSQN